MPNWERLVSTGENNGKGFMEDKEFELDIERWVKWTGRNGKVQVETSVAKGTFVGKGHIWE